MTNEETMIAKHIDECNKRINVIEELEYVSSYVADECKHNIEVLKTTIDALEKQISKKPDYVADGYDNNGNIIYDVWICPNCGSYYEIERGDYVCCPHCGQWLDWSEYDE